MSKLSFRESVLNMLGEFVALNKSPEFRLNPKSSQFIDEAMKSEYEKLRLDTVHSLQTTFDELDNEIQFIRKKNASCQPMHSLYPDCTQCAVPSSKRSSIFGRLKSKKRPDKHQQDLLNSKQSSISRTSSSDESDASVFAFPHVLTIRR